MEGLCLAPFSHTNSNFNIKVKKVKSMPWRHIRGGRDVALVILNLSMSWRWMATFTTQLFYPPEKNPGNTEKETCELKSQFVCFEEDECPLLVPGTEPWIIQGVV